MRSVKKKLEFEKMKLEFSRMLKEGVPPADKCNCRGWVIDGVMAKQGKHHRYCHYRQEQ